MSDHLNYVNCSSESLEAYLAKIGNNLPDHLEVSLEKIILLSKIKREGPLLLVFEGDWIYPENEYPVDLIMRGRPGLKGFYFPHSKGFTDEESKAKTVFKLVTETETIIVGIM